MSAAESVSAYCLAFLIFILYTVDAVVQWRTPQGRSWKYLLSQLCVVVLFLAAEVVLVFYDQKEQKQANRVFLYILQGLSLLQSFVLEAMIYWRVYLVFKGCLHWAFFPCCLAVLGFGSVAFASFLRGDDYCSSRIFLAMAAIITHGFTTCSSLRRFDDMAFNQEKLCRFHNQAFHPYRTVGTTALPARFILFFNLAAIPVSLLVSLLPSITIFLLVETIISFISSLLWVSLLLYKFELEKKPHPHPHPYSRSLECAEESF